MLRGARSDLALALALAVPSVAQVLIWPIAPRPIGVVLALWTTLPVAWRRRRPLAAALATTLPAFYPTDGYVVVGYVAYFIVFYSAAAHSANRRGVLAVVGFGLLASVVASWLNHEVPGEYFGALSAVAPPAVAGGAVRHQRAQSARMAAAEERARIARELHDVVSHSLSVIAIQSSAAEAALERDPALAGPPLAAIRSSSEQALAEMRRMLGVLRTADEADELSPQPGLARLPELVQHARAAGIEVTLEVAGTPRPLPASVDLSAFRIVQEALTNVRKHASGAPVTVRVGWEAADGAAAVELARRLDPDVVLMDVRMPRMDGIEATRRIGLAGLRARVLMLTTFDLDEHVYDALHAGASGFLLKDAGRERLVEAVRTVAAGESLFAPSVLQRLVDHYVARPPAGRAVGLDRLSESKVEVLALVGRGYSNGEIAEALVISHATVKTHVRNVLAKLGLRDRVQGVVAAYESGLLQPGAPR